MNNELLTQVESIKSLLIARASGVICNEDLYNDLRHELIASPHVSRLLPHSVQVCRSLNEFWGFIKPKFDNYTDRREYLRQEFEPILRMLETESSVPSDSIFSSMIQGANLSSVQDAWQKALDRRTYDPEGAITVARTLLESVCKHVLDSTGEPYDNSADLSKLYSLTAKQLNLSPSQHSEQLFKQILGSCQSVVEGLGAIRNRHSDAHGKGQSEIKPAQRHAELAVNLAGSMSMFLLQTLEVRQK